MIIDVNLTFDEFYEASSDLRGGKSHDIIAPCDTIRCQVERNGSTLLEGVRDGRLLLRVVNSENKGEWFLTLCRDYMISANMWTISFRATGIYMVTNTATRNLLSQTAYSEDDLYWRVVEERALHEFVGTYSENRAWSPQRDRADAAVEASVYMNRWMHSQVSDFADDLNCTAPPFVRVPYRAPVLQDAGLPIQPLSDLISDWAPIRFEPQQDKADTTQVDAEPLGSKMSINELLFGGD